MKLRTYLIVAAVAAAVATGRSSAAGQADGYPVLASAAPADRSYIAVRADAVRRLFRADPDLYSGATPTVAAEQGIIVEWREQVFEALREQNLAPGPADGFRAGEDVRMRTVARIAMKETVKLALQGMPRVEQLVRALKLEVSTDMFRGGEEESPAPAAAVPIPVQHRAEKERFFMKTGLRVPVESGKLGLLSETNAEYGKMSSFFVIRLDDRLDYRLGLRYALDRGMIVEIERRTENSQDPAVAGRSVSNVVKLVFAF